MSYTIDVRPDQPVIIVTYEGAVDAKELAEAQQAVALTAQKIGADRIFCIQDIRNSRASFLDGMTNLREFMYKQRKNRAEGLQVMIIFVGINPVVKAFMQLMPMAPKQRYRVSAVDDINEALALVKRLAET